MVNSSRSESRRGLRLGVIQKGKVIEEILVREPRAVHVGTAPSNVLVTGPEGTPESFTLFDPQGDDGYRLNLGADMVAHVEYEQESVDLYGEEQLELALQEP